MSGVLQMPHVEDSGLLRSVIKSKKVAAGKTGTKPVQIKKSTGPYKGAGEF